MSNSLAWEERNWVKTFEGSCSSVSGSLAFGSFPALLVQRPSLFNSAPLSEREHFSTHFFFIFGSQAAPVTTHFRYLNFVALYVEYGNKIKVCNPDQMEASTLLTFDTIFSSLDLIFFCIQKLMISRIPIQTVWIILRRREPYRNSLI